MHIYIYIYRGNVDTIPVRSEGHRQSSRSKKPWGLILVEVHGRRHPTLALVVQCCPQSTSVCNMSCFRIEV